MFGKLVLIILVSGVTAAALLTLRQQRIVAAHEMSILHQQMIEQERASWRLHSEIAVRCRPEEVRRLLERLPGRWVPIPDPVSAAGPSTPQAPPETGATADDEGPLGG